MKPTWIGIGGNKFGAGKDTVALRLTDYGYKTYAFGGPLKTEVLAVLTDADYRDDVWDQMPGVCRDAILVCLALGQLDPFAKPTTPEMRLALQTYGTEFRRAQDEKYWLKALDQEIEVDNAPYVVIPDMRFPNEFNHVREKGESWYVVRPDDAYAYTAGSMSKHASEGQLEHLEHDWRVVNDSTVTALWGKVDDRMQTYGVAPPWVTSDGLAMPWLTLPTGDVSGQTPQRPPV